MGVFGHPPPSKPGHLRAWHLGSSQLGGQRFWSAPPPTSRAQAGAPSPRANTGGSTAGPAGPGCPGRPPRPRPGCTRRVPRPCPAELASVLSLPSMCIVLGTVSQKAVQSQSPLSVNLTSLGSRVSADAIKLRRGHTGVDASPVAGVSRRREVWIQTRREKAPRRRGGRDWAIQPR